MTDQQLIEWIEANHATVGPCLVDRGECTGWFCKTPLTTMFFAESLDRAILKCKEALEK